MAIHVIYHHTQREQVNRWLESFIKDGWEFDLAPLGLEVGSAEWKDEVKQSISEADAAIALLTNEAMEDPLVEWRARIVRDQGKLLIPVVLEKDHNYPRSGVFATLQYVLGVDEEGKARLSRLLPQLIRRRYPKCFISYSRKDITFASKLSIDLRVRGIKVWRDEEDIPSGSLWDQEIEKAIKESTHFLLIASSDAINSKVVIDELSFALDENKVVIPCIIEIVKLPMRIRRSQWINFTKDYEMALSQLIQNLRK